MQSIFRPEISLDGGHFAAMNALTALLMGTFAELSDYSQHQSQKTCQNAKHMCKLYIKLLGYSTNLV